MGSTGTGSAESFWRGRIEAWRASGQSRGDHCTAQGLSRKTFGWWAWRLDRERRPAETGGRSGRFLPVEVAKHQDGQPLYHQCQIFARDGVTLDRQTAADWLGRVAWWLSPLWERRSPTCWPRPSCSSTTPTCRCWTDGPRP